MASFLATVISYSWPVTGDNHEIQFLNSNGRAFWMSITLMHLLRDCFCSGQTLPLLGCWIGLYCDSSASLRTRGTTALAGMNKTRSYAASSTTGSTCRSSPDPPPSWCGGHSVSPRQAAAQSFDSRGTATSWLCSLCLMTQDSFCSITTGLL